MLLEPPPDDHARSRSRAKATKACAALEPARPRSGDEDVARQVETPECASAMSRQQARSRPPAGDEPDAEAALYGAPHRLLEAELQRNLQVAQAASALAQLVLDHLPDAGAALHQDQRPPYELV
jgi:hypothetical protein